MATVLNYFSASIYYKNLSSGAGALNPYKTMGFPCTGSGLIFEPTSYVVNGVTCNAIINVLPTGLVVPPGQYYTDSTVDNLITKTNG